MKSIVRCDGNTTSMHFNNAKKNVLIKIPSFCSKDYVFFFHHKVIFIFLFPVFFLHRLTPWFCGANASAQRNLNFGIVIKSVKIGFFERFFVHQISVANNVNLVTIISAFIKIPRVLCRKRTENRQNEKCFFGFKLTSNRIISLCALGVCDQRQQHAGIRCGFR